MFQDTTARPWGEPGRPERRAYGEAARRFGNEANELVVCVDRLRCLTEELRATSTGLSDSVNRLTENLAAFRAQALRAGDPDA